MNEKPKRNLLTALLAVFIIIMMLLVLILFSPPSRSDEVSQQIVLQVVSNGGQKFVVPKATVVLHLVGLSGATVKAPLSRGDMMICRTYDFVDESKAQHAGFKCGTDIYVIAGIGYNSK